MTQALNYTAKAIDALKTQVSRLGRLDQRGMIYLIDKMRQAQVFVLPDYGQLLDRSKPRPEVPEVMLKPPFAVTAVEFPAPATPSGFDPVYNAIGSSRRIALAWDWQEDFPHADLGILPGPLGPGVAVASICWLDKYQDWSVMSCALHTPYSEAWRHDGQARTPFVEAAIASGRMNPAQLNGPRLAATPVPLFPEMLNSTIRLVGGDRAMDAMGADVMDEANAYFDLCLALACRNVATETRPAPTALNKERIRKGKAPLFSTHVLKLDDVALGGTGAAGERTSPRQHLRRGHIRRLAPERITWVNQTMVRGRGFVDKVYSL